MMMGLTAEQAERLFGRVQPQGDCWIWTGGHTSGGYGAAYVSGDQNRQAHRVIYEALVGPVPEGMDLDHLCRVRDCVNPDHVEAVTRRTNVLRGASSAAKRARQTHCKNGHPYTPENTYQRPDGNGRRNCKECRRASDRRRRPPKKQRKA